MSHPIRGGLYRIETALLTGSDPKPRRPAVVIALPPFGLPDVPVVTRTSDTAERGVHHPANHPLGLTKDGVFAFRFQRAIDRRYFQVTTAVEFLGMLEELYFDKIVAWWEQ